MGWTVDLDGVTLGSDGDATIGCLTSPPVGLGMAELETGDVDLLGRDGVEHFNDWYPPRILTFTVSVCAADPCPGCGPLRARVATIVSAWSRRCNDAVLTIWPPCGPDGCDPSDVWTWPYQVIGRPRVAEVDYSTSNHGCADLLLRFDGRDHRLLLADCNGDPIVDDADLAATTSQTCREYPRCYPVCYDVSLGAGPGGAVDVDVAGTECVCPTVEFVGPLTDPAVVNVESGASVGIDGYVPPGTTYVVDGCTCTARQGGADRSWLVTGDCPFLLEPGENTLQLQAAAGDGTVNVSWRPTVLVG